MDQCTHRIGDKSCPHKELSHSLRAMSAKDNVYAPHFYVINTSDAIRKYAEKYAEREIKCGQGVQNAALVANGMSSVGVCPVVVGDASDLEKASSQLKACALTGGTVTVVGLNSGVGNGRQGHSGMALSDIATFRSLSNSTVLCPSDACSLRAAVEIACNRRGFTYIRCPWSTEVLYDHQTQFGEGRCVVKKQSALDVVTIVAVGSCVAYALQASERLNASNVNARVIDLFSAKPLDKENIL